MREFSGQQKRLEDELESVRGKLATSEQAHQSLKDEYQALQLTYSSHEVKLREVESENDRLVSPEREREREREIVGEGVGWCRGPS